MIRNKNKNGNYIPQPRLYLSPIWKQIETKINLFYYRIYYKIKPPY